MQQFPFKYQYWYFLYQGLVFLVPLLVEKIPALGTKLYSVVILLVLIPGRHNMVVTSATLVAEGSC